MEKRKVASARFREFVLTHLFWFFASARLLAGLAVALVVWRHWSEIQFVATTCGEKVGRAVEAVLAALLATIIIAILQLATSPKIDSFFRKLINNVNLGIPENDLEIIQAYVRSVSARVRDLLPPELREIAADGAPRPSEVFLKVQGDEEASLQAHRSGRGPRSRIPDFVAFIDEEYLLTTTHDLPPLIVQGEPGSGKSTLLFDLLRLLRVRLARGHGWIPIIIFVHDLSLDLIQKSGQR